MTATSRPTIRLHQPSVAIGAVLALVALSIWAWWAGILDGRQTASWCCVCVALLAALRDEGVPHA